MNIWIILLLGGLVTFATRFSFIYMFGKFHIPERVRKALHYVPPAVLSAIFFPELFLHDGVLDLSFGNVRLLAGLVAVTVAWSTRSILATFIAGMTALFLLQLFF